MEKLTAKETRTKILWEISDLLAGAAFPFILMLTLNALIVSYTSYGTDDGIRALCLIVGEILLFAAYFIFGRRNGVTAYRKYVLNSKKRQIGTDEKKVIYKTGEYAVYKAIIIGLLSCVPYIIFQLVNCIFENSVCSYVLQYCFGWAYYPFNLLSLPEWLNFIWIIPLVAMHTIAYIVGKKQEEKKVKIIEEAQKKGKKKK